MVTGVETAGLVLAALPLIISALEHYNEGIETLKNFVRYRVMIAELAKNLTVERRKFITTCEKLLSGIVESEVKLALLLHNPSSAAWKEQSLAERLQERLRDSYAVYFYVAHELEEALATLADKIGLDSQGKPRWVDTKSHKQYWKRFVTCLNKKEHEALLARISSDNQSLRRLTDDSLLLEPIRLRRQHGKTSFEAIRNHAARLHSALQSRWSCDCSHPHYAHLQLEERDWNQTPCFRLTFPMIDTACPSPLWTWHTTEIKVFERTQPAAQIADCLVTGSRSDVDQLSWHRHLDRQGLDSPLTKTKKTAAWAVIPGVQAASVLVTSIQNPPGEPNSINDMCSSLRSISLRLNKSCIGRLTHKESSYDVFTVSRHEYQDVDVSTLHDLLSRSQGVPMDASTKLTRRARLQLAVILASTALQLHTTPWLDTSWNGKTIKFHQGALGYPYISKLFTKSMVQSIETPALAIGPIRNRTLFALGVLLLELSTGKPLDDFKGPESSGPFEDFILATQLVKNLEEEESLNYLDATAACIFCNFRCKASELDFGKEAFRQAFYEDVVVPLEQDLKNYCMARS
ncbi:MAG: hypothetical protein Q9213_006382 [Squamulea squamosa]